jgi:hypothetical protein
MIALTIFLTLFYIGYRVTRQARAQSPRVQTRASATGDAGEALVDADLRRALMQMCGDDFYLHPGPIILHHAPGTAFPTAELDHLAITPFGMFVFETKNWVGYIEPGVDDDSLVRVAPSGSREMRRSPLKQNRSKVAYLRAVMPAMWPVEGFGVFASDQCSIAPTLHPALLHRHDIQYALRMKKWAYDKHGHRSLNVHATWQAVLSVADIHPDAVEKHRERVRSNDQAPKGLS